MSHEKTLVKNTAIMTIGTLCTKVLAFIVIPLFSGWLSVEDYGLFDLYSTYVTLLLPVLTLSCGEAVFRFLIDCNDDENHKEIVSSGFMVVLIGLLMGSICVALFVEMPTIVKVSFLVYMIAEILNNFLLSYVRGIKKLKIYAMASIVVMLASTIFVTLFVWIMKMELAGILLGYSLGYSVSCGYLLFTSGITRNISVTKMSKQQVKALLLYSMPLIPNTICWWIMNVSDRTIVKMVLGPATLGVYAIACKIPSLCTTLFGVFQLSWQQSVSETINDKDREIFYNKVLNNLLCVLLSLCIGVLSVNFVFFDYVFDSKYAMGYWHIGILIPATALSSIAAYLGGIFIGQKETKRNGGTTIITAMINIVSHIGLVNFIGVYAASVSTLIAYVLLVVIRWLMIRKTIKLHLTKKSTIMISVTLYFCAIQYYRNPALEYFNICIATVLFIYINKEFLRKVVHKT